MKEKYPKFKFVEGNILQTEISSPITQKLLDVIIWTGKRDGIIKFVCEVDTKDHKAFDESDAKLLREKLTIVDDQRYQYAAFYNVDPGENQYDVAFKMFCNILDLLLNTKKE